MSIVETSNAQDHSTTKLTAYDLNNRSLVGNVAHLTGIRLWDTWGLNNSVLEFPLLLRLMKGQVPDGFEMQAFEKIESNKASYEDYGDTYGALIAKSAVVFFWKEAHLMVDSNRKVARELIGNATAAGYSPLVVLTHIERPSHKIEELRRECAAILEIEGHRVFHFLGYVQKEARMKKDGNIDRNVFQILEAAVINSGKYLKKESMKGQEAGVILGNYFAEHGNAKERLEAGGGKAGEARKKLERLKEKLEKMERAEAAAAKNARRRTNSKTKERSAPAEA